MIDTRRIGAWAACALLAAATSNAQEIGFEPNLGQTHDDVLFVERGAGHTLFLTRDEFVFRTSGGVLRLSLQAADPRSIDAERPTAARSHYLQGTREHWVGDVQRFGAVRYAEALPGIDLLFYGSPDELEFDFELASGVDADAIRLDFEGQDRLELRADGTLVAHLGETAVAFSAPQAYQDRGTERRSVRSAYVQRADGSVGFTVGPHDAELPLVIDPVVLYSSFLGGSDLDSARGVVVADGHTYVAGWTASVDFPVQGSLKAAPTGDFDAFLVKLDDDGRGIVFATYLGGSSSDFATDLAVDPDGNIYLTGRTSSGDFPVENALQPEFGGFIDAFVTKLSPSGNRVLFSTFLGGAGIDLANAIEVDAFQQAHVCGTTSSDDFPTRNALEPNYGGGVIFGDGFLSGLNSDGNLAFSTYVGGSNEDQARDLALDPAGNIALVGTTQSEDFPVENALQAELGGGNDGFVMQLEPKASGIHYATYLGGQERDFASGVVFDALGNVCVVGDTSSADFPTRAPFQSQLNGFCDAFCTLIKPPGVLGFSTYLGGGDIDAGLRIALDNRGDLVIVGQTFSRDFPTRFAAQRRFAGGFADGFVTRMRAGGRSMPFSSYLGGAGFEIAAAVGLDEFGTATVVGDGTASSDFPQVRPFQAEYGGGSTDAFVTRLCIRPRECALPFHARRSASPVSGASEAGAEALVGMLELLRSGRSPLDPPE